MLNYQKDGRGSLSVTASVDNITVSRWVDKAIVNVVSSYTGFQPVDKVKHFFLFLLATKFIVVIYKFSLIA